jgi:Ras family protein A
MECSAKTNQGVRDVFEAATREALDTKKKKDRKCTVI